MIAQKNTQQTATNHSSDMTFRGMNRRQHHRFAVERPSKVFRRASNTFVPARTVNLSVGGALVEAAAARPFEVGEIVDIGVAYRTKQGAVVRENAMLQAVVVRVAPASDEPANPRQQVALRYVNPRHTTARAA
jgi:hypothetical protein